MAVLPATLAVTAALTAALLAGPASAATASTSPSPTPSGTTTITVDTATLNHLCDERLPQMLTRATDRLSRIQGDASTVGSVAWTDARADKAETEGHADLAARLRLRADQRSGRVGQVTAAIARIVEIQSTICSQRAGA